MAYPFSSDLTSAITSSHVMHLSSSFLPFWDQPQFRFNFYFIIYKRRNIILLVFIFCYFFKKRWKAQKGEKLRIGYVSPDLKGNHPVGRSIYNLFSLHDKEKFEIFIYFLNPNDGSYVYRKVKNL